MQFYEKDIKKLFMNMVLNNKNLKKRHQFDGVQLMTYGT